MCPMLACLCFRADGAIASLILLFLVEPLAYFAYIQSFRFRVSAPLPMTMRQAFALALLQAAVGLGIVVAGALALFELANNRIALLIAWVWLYTVRLFGWELIGRYARITGRRLTGFVAGGMFLNLGCDFAIATGLALGWIPLASIVLALVTLILFLDRFGKKSHLRARFTNPHRCPVCDYDPRGNVSGICPECGTPFRAALPRQNLNSLIPNPSPTR